MTFGGQTSNFDKYIKIEYLSLFGFEIKPQCESWLSHIAQMLMVLQLFFHIPFTYYIAKEHLLVCVDEVMNQSLSLMIDRKRKTVVGDPRFFLAERDRKKYFHIVNSNAQLNTDDCFQDKEFNFLKDDQTNVGESLELINKNNMVKYKESM